MRDSVWYTTVGAFPFDLSVFRRIARKNLCHRVTQKTCLADLVFVYLAWWQAGEVVGNLVHAKKVGKYTVVITTPAAATDLALVKKFIYAGALSVQAAPVDDASAEALWIEVLSALDTQRHLSDLLSRALKS